MAVQHNLLGKSGEDVSRLGFGCMRLPRREDGSIDRAHTEAMFERAIAGGVNYFDTAYMYHDGESERVVGELLRSYDRALWRVTTKLPLSQISSLAQARRIFDDQRRKMGLDYFDHYLLHNINTANWKTVQDCALLDFIQELKADGRVGQIGFSFHGDYALFETALRAAPWDLCQIQYNYMDEETQAGTRGYKLAEELGVAMVVMEPVRGGALARLSPDLEAQYRRVSPGASSASLAMRWVAEHPNAKVILSGMSDLTQVEDNLATFSDLKPLTDAEREAIAHAIAVMKKRQGNACTGCRYCMPCPQGVNIPGVFSLWNQYHQYRNYAVADNSWNHFWNPAEKPNHCIGCGACETKCPQQLPIREDLARAQDELDHPVW